MRTLNEVFSTIEPTKEDEKEFLLSNSDSIRCEIARHPQCFSAWLITLSFDVSSSVRMAVAVNPATPIDVIANMRKRETHPDVIDALNRR